MFLQSSIKEKAVCTPVCLLFIPSLFSVGFGVVLHPSLMPRHSHAASQSKVFPSLPWHHQQQPLSGDQEFGAVWSPEKEMMGISGSSDGRVQPGAWGGAWRAPTTAVSLERAHLYFKELQIAAGLRICL